MNETAVKPEKKELKIANWIWITVTVVLALVFAVGAAALAVAEPWAGVPAFDFYTGPEEAQMEAVTVSVGKSVVLAPEMTENEAVREVSVSDADILSNDGLTVTALGDYDGAFVSVTTREKQVLTSGADSVVIFGADVTDSYNSLRSWLREKMGLEGFIAPRTELRDVCVYTYPVTVDGCEMQQGEDPIKLIVGQTKGVISADDGLDHEVENDNVTVVEAVVAVGRIELTPLEAGEAVVTVYSGFYKTPEGGEKVFVPVRACEYSVEVTSGSGQAPYTPSSGGSGGQSSSSGGETQPSEPSSGGLGGQSSSGGGETQPSEPSSGGLGGQSSPGGGEMQLSEPSSQYVYSNNYAAAAEMLAMVNAARAEAGVGALSWSSSLADSAAVRSRESAVLFSHTRPDGTPWYTVSDLARGENLAAGYSTAAGAFAELMASPGHRENILRESFTTMGACLCTTDAPGYKYFWCQLFG